MKWKETGIVNAGRITTEIMQINVWKYLNAEITKGGEEIHVFVRVVSSKTKTAFVWRRKPANQMRI